MPKERRSNWELLRIVAMIMIVYAHLSCHGVMHVTDATHAYELWATGTFANRCFASLMSAGGRVGVALFFMLSGYFCLNREKPSVFRTTSLVAFYVLVLSIACILISTWDIHVSGLTRLFVVRATKAMLACVAPISWGGYWFVTAYVLLMLVSPLYNVFLKN